MARLTQITRPRRTVGLSFVVGLLGAAIISFVVLPATHSSAGAGTHGRITLPGPARPLDATTTGVSSVLLKHFKVLRRARVADLTTASVPAIVAEGFTSGPHSSTFRPDPADAQEVSVSATASAWIVPAATGLCEYDPAPVSWVEGADGGPGGFAGCSSVSAVDSGNDVNNEFGPDGQQRVVGLAPDGNSTVTMTATDGLSETVPVIDNVYVAYGTSTAPWVSVTLDDAAGARVTVTLAS